MLHEQLSSTNGPAIIRRPFHWRWVLGLILLLVFCYLITLLLIRPGDRLVTFEQARPFGVLLYDDYEAACYCLRGLNATLGRRPFGRTEELPYDPPPPPGQTDPLTKRLNEQPPAPLRPRYFLEYPPPTLWIFRLGFWGASLPESIPPAILDASKHDLVYHQPRNDTERALWWQFRLASHVYAALMLTCLAGLAVVLYHGYEPAEGVRHALLLMALPAGLYFTANRFDIIPALLVALSFACLGRDRIAFAGLLLGMATMVKLYPILLAPVVCAYLWPKRKSCFVFASVYAATSLLMLVPWLIKDSVTATWAPFAFQLTRTYSAPSGSFYDCILPPALAGGDWLARACRTGAVALTVGFFVWRRPFDLTQLLRAGSVILIIFISLQVFYSPQWILWLSPLLIPLARSDARIFILYIALDAVIYWSFPVYSWLEPVTIWPRFLVLLALLGALLWMKSGRSVRVADQNQLPDPVGV